MSSKCFKLALLVIFIVVFPACLVAGDNDNTLIPLAIGNSWVYQIDMFMGDSPTPVQTLTDTAVIKSKKEWGGHTWYSFSEPSAESAEYLRYSDNGQYRLLIDRENPDGKAERFADLPLKVNDSWIIANKSITVVVEAAEETVTVPAGEFDGCYRCRLSMPEGVEGTMWLKPGVGQVKMEFSMSKGDMKIRSTRMMKEYHLK